ncbi:endo-1,4-beta-xylanase [Saccharicrinis sp. FJH54]|uniref:endo-1,4-beta-xylanase n=1 Tax=Saccharicrinis sp. FJH54 TaxID=3344665 RepID=UPI0035D49A96
METKFSGRRASGLYYALLFLMVLSTIACVPKSSQKELVLKDAFKGKFYLGTALNGAQITGRDTLAVRIVKEQFNAIVAENCMKSASLQPEEGRFNFSLADQFVKFGEENDMFISGHTLIWHSQIPRWFFTDSLGNDVTPEVLKERMKQHILTVVGRYKGRVEGWDVVNEAILDDGSYRQSKFYQILGKDFIKLAFRLAHQADPEAELYYNDYSMANAGKREGVVKMVKELQQEGIRIDGIGMQTHIGLSYPDLAEYEKSMEAFAGLGLKVMITEMDLTVLPSPWGNTGADIAQNKAYQEKINPYKDGLPDSVLQKFNARYLDFFGLFLKHQDQISRVTFWGVTDANSWRNNWPVRGRTDYPLLFDRSGRAKPVVTEIIQETKK